MQLIKEKIRSTGRDINIKIPLTANNNLNGLQQSINDYVERETGLSINPVTDGETFRFKRDIDKTFNFKFFSGGTYSNTLLNAGFTQSEIDSRNDILTNSFYILQIYDSINRQNQTLLHNSYYNGSSFTNATSNYNTTINQEFSNLYIPEWFIHSTSNIEVYGSLLFFNAKTGKIQVFYNEDNEGLTTEDKMYHIITINKSTKTYSFNNVNNILSKELSNVDYVNSINNSVSSFVNEIPQFPVGTKFNTDGTYNNVT